jgi:hypothetical protein
MDIIMAGRYPPGFAERARDLCFGELFPICTLIIEYGERVAPTREAERFSRVRPSAPAKPFLLIIVTKMCKICRKLI